MKDKALQDLLMSQDCCLFQEMHADKLEARFEEGIWLGIESRTGEIRIGMPSGVVKSRTIRRRIEAERWDTSRIGSIDSFPLKPYEDQYITRL